MSRKTIIDSTIVILTFFIAFYGKRILSNYFTISISSDYFKIAYSYLWWILPTVLITGLLLGFNKICDNIGILKGFRKGLIFSIITVLPMLIGSALIGHIAEDLKLLGLIHHTLIAGFMEEFLFRGFLFGILFRKLGWGFIPASILGALIFGLGHMYQGSTLLETTGVFFVTSIGAIWFAWLYIEWNNNLWVPIFLHILMNLSWVLFEVSDNALGGFSSNLFRIITITLTIIITIKYNKKNGLRINRNNLIVNNNNR
ncbi:MAG: type II CAAX endopeptidase family protein [Candidatus Cloacimonadota bacterium]|nr:type II CAAX endopeptidase family protein [Candidatus Cloacimonadota bacterium]